MGFDFTTVGQKIGTIGFEDIEKIEIGLKIFKLIDLLQDSAGLKLVLFQWENIIYPNAYLDNS